MQIIAITGYAGHGKDTVGAILKKQYGFFTVAFADPIRTMLGSLYDEIGVDRNVMHDRDLKEAPIPGLGVSYRHMAQTLGTEWAREHLSPNFWVDVLKARLVHLRNRKVYRVAITDLRFHNEAAAVRDIGGVIWRVQRQGVKALKPHASEIQIGGIKPHAIVPNNGTIEELENRIKILME